MELRAAPETAGDDAPRVVETHTATLFFVGDRVYKRKKAVRFPFLDFRTIEQREAACRAEVDLNRRLAPDTYLGVATILGTDGRPCDHLVVMRRLPDDRRLSALLGSDEAPDRIREIARCVAVFHARSPTSAAIAAAASRDAVRRNWDDNFDEMRRFVGVHLDPAEFEHLERLAHRFLSGRAPLFTRRIQEGMVRDGHGDLQADDIFCLRDGPRILDCIEFNDALRYSDVVGDVAFLAMDLERLGRPDMAELFLSWYREFSGTDAPAGLVHLSIAYRAQVRAKVACLRAEQGETTAPIEAARLLSIARRHLERGRVIMIVVGGLPGTGKTTLTHALAEARSLAHLHSDEIRKELAGFSARVRATAPFGEGLYRPAMTRRAYGALLTRARALLSMGTSVILDASWIDRGLRDWAAATAFGASAELVELQCSAPADVAADRIRERATGVAASDATTDVANRMASMVTPWPSAFCLDTSAPPAWVLQQAIGALEDPGPDAKVTAGGEPRADAWAAATRS